MTSPTSDKAASGDEENARLKAMTWEQAIDELKDKQDQGRFHRWLTNRRDDFRGIPFFKLVQRENQLVDALRPRVQDAWDAEVMGDLEALGGRVGLIWVNQNPEAFRVTSTTDPVDPTDPKFNVVAERAATLDALGKSVGHARTQAIAKGVRGGLGNPALEMVKDQEFAILPNHLDSMLGLMAGSQGKEVQEKMRADLASCSDLSRC